MMVYDWLIGRQQQLIELLATDVGTRVSSLYEIIIISMVGSSLATEKVLLPQTKLLLKTLEFATFTLATLRQVSVITKACRSLSQFCMLYKLLSWARSRIAHTNSNSVQF